MVEQGRNEPCHCGSGHKYKNCCLPKDEQKAREALLASKPEAEPKTAATADQAKAATPTPGKPKRWERPPRPVR
jgi:hypothetical protein